MTPPSSCIQHTLFRLHLPLNGWCTCVDARYRVRVTMNPIPTMWFCLRRVGMYRRKGRGGSSGRGHRLIYLFGSFFLRRPTSSRWWHISTCSAVCGCIFLCRCAEVQTNLLLTYLKMLVNSRRRIVRISLIFFHFFSLASMSPWNKRRWMRERMAAVTATVTERKKSW